MKPLWGSFLCHIATSCCRILYMHEGGTQEYVLLRLLDRLVLQ